MVAMANHDHGIHTDPSWVINHGNSCHMIFSGNPRRSSSMEINGGHPLLDMKKTHHWPSNFGPKKRGVHSLRFCCKDKAVRFLSPFVLISIGIPKFEFKITLNLAFVQNPSVAPSMDFVRNWIPVLSRSPWPSVISGWEGTTPEVVAAQGMDVLWPRRDSTRICSGLLTLQGHGGSSIKVSIKRKHGKHLQNYDSHWFTMYICNSYGKDLQNNLQENMGIAGDRWWNTQIYNSTGDIEA